MGISTINNNLAAQFAQQNISLASSNSATSVARLSSGNRIVQASDDVAALAIGASLGTQVNALKTASSNAAQGGSLLQVADGALAQIQSILQQQQSLALQAKAGSLNDTQRGFLNQQFSKLTAQIDNLAIGTTFNGVNLIDGSIATGGSNNPLRNANVDATIPTVTDTGYTSTGGVGFTSTGISGGGATFNQPTSAVDTTFYGDISRGTFAVTTAGSTIGTDTTRYSITYTLDGVAYQGYLATTNVNGGVTAAAEVFLTSATSNTGTIRLKVGASPFVGASGGTNNSTAIATALTDYFKAAKVVSNTASVTVDGFTSTSGISAIAVYNQPAQNDTTLLGDLSAGVFQVTGDASAGYQVSYSLNGSTYQGKLSAIQVTSGRDLILTNGKSIIALTVGAAAAATATNASTFQAALTTSFAGATGYAIHKVATTLAKDTNGNDIAGSAITATSTAGTILGGFDGSKVKIQSALFDSTKLPPIAGFSATGSGASTVFSVLVNGVTYSTDSAVTIGSPTLLNGITGLGGTGFLTFYKSGDNTSNEKVTLDLSGIGASARIDTTSNVSRVIDALNTAFGTGGSAGGLTFQLGTTDTSNVTVNIASARSTALYNGVAQDISTQGGASTAATAVAAALNTLTAIRSSVGAFQTQFNFASAAIQSSVQNQSAAQASLLDTDVSAESTSFAISQVKLQAGISVLAQANQQLQLLLKLIQG